MSKVVYAKTSVVVAHAGHRHALRAGEPWDGDDPLVQRYPDMFVQQLPAVRSTQDPRGFREYEPPVERATRAPGERRTTKRVTTKSGEDQAPADGE